MTKSAKGIKKECEECGEKLLGRSDKRFCSDACRNAHNNRLNSDVNNFMRNINNVLRKNRRILSELCKEEKNKAMRDTLLQEGFDFNYFTHIYTTQKGTVYYYCYEYGYLPINEKYILIIKKEF